jgi:hypothetical protein
VNPAPKQAVADPSRYQQPGRSTGDEVSYRAALDDYFVRAGGSNVEKLENFTKFVPRQTLARYLCLTEVFKLVLEVQGDIFECGVNWGGGLMGFAQLSAILEPVNLQRRIVGFDTFSGFVEIAEQDATGALFTAERRAGGYEADCLADLQECVSLFDRNRFIGHVQKVVLVPGDVSHSLPRFLAENPHTVVSLLHLDFDLYEPTKTAIEHLVPRMPRGSVILFDELNNRTWPGETLAVMETLGLPKLRIKRFAFEPHMSYAVLD